MRAFVDTHRGTFGVEPICTALQIAPSGYLGTRRGNATHNGAVRERSAMRR